MVSGLGVTAPQAMVLNFLSREDRISSHKLGRKAELDSATLTGILDRLEAGGFIERRPNPTDRRSIWVFLTKKGRQTALEIGRLVKKANTGFLRTLSAEEVKSLKSLLERIRVQEAGNEIPAAGQNV
jgi:MarR family transcriptional regulator, organic hydroperoxide resistance regulator